MIQTPDDFEIRLDLELTDESIVHPFIGQSLVLTADAPRLQSWACYRALGLQAHLYVVGSGDPARGHEVRMSS